MSLITIFGGAFQTSAGEVMSNGTLLFELSHDEQETGTTPPGQVVSGLKVRVSLDSKGNVPLADNIQLWSNSELLPSGSFYILRGWDETGTDAYGPQFITIPDDNPPYDLGNIVPAFPPGNGLGGGVGATLILKTNHVVNPVQSI